MSKKIDGMAASNLEICRSCTRYILETGSEVQIELAKNRESSEEFLDWYQSIVKGNLINRLKGYKKREIMQCFADFLIRLESYSNGNDLNFPREVNRLHLDPLLMEYKTGFIRAPYFKVLDASACGIKTERITHGFLKKSQKTNQAEIRKGLAIIKTDGSYQV